MALVWGTAWSAWAGDTVLPDARRQAEIIHLVRQDCGSCHGMTLAGGLGPSLLSAALKDKDPPFLQSTILFGRPGTPMPPWKDFLSETETRWLVDQLIKGLPDAH